MYRFRRTYHGPVRGVILDWAGTTVDHGSRAPVQAFRGVFASEAVPVTEAEAREPMGMGKWHHIQAMTQQPRIRAAWTLQHGSAPGDGDIDRMFESFLPRQIELASAGSPVLRGVAETVKALRARDIKIGSTTGYPRVVLEPVLKQAARAGYAPDCAVTASDVSPGRPAPWMLLEAARRLDVWPMSSLVKVDDATVGIEAGLNAGCWTVGVTRTGNLVGCSEEEVAAMMPTERAQRVRAAERAMYRVGAHYTIEDLTELPAVIDQIERRLQQGQQP